MIWVHFFTSASISEFDDYDPGPLILGPFLDVELHYDVLQAFGGERLACFSLGKLAWIVRRGSDVQKFSHVRIVGESL